MGKKVRMRKYGQLRRGPAHLSGEIDVRRVRREPDQGVGVEQLVQQLFHGEVLPSELQQVEYTRKRLGGTGILSGGVTLLSRERK